MKVVAGGALINSARCLSKEAALDRWPTNQLSTFYMNPSRRPTFCNSFGSSKGRTAPGPFKNPLRQT